VLVAGLRGAIARSNKVESIIYSPILTSRVRTATAILEDNPLVVLSAMCTDSRADQHSTLDDSPHTPEIFWGVEDAKGFNTSLIGGGVAEKQTHR
jgi:hypothetical protein